MRITVEISLYPLNEAFVGDIREFILRLRQQAGLEIRSNQMSTQIRGDYDDVTSALNRCMRYSMEKTGSVVFVVKYLNADLDIATAPDIESSG
jgi:uncharacterized protein YqgV (UPF0045/DUF77 family)